ncbi:MAG: hypothetical protein JWQ84_1876 [Mucilaginibacter sp.]|nr:hypothetical protein [Mucilaginibacter sp.]MDB5017044.1 hypothetical protein [Mucilaginibacter sp.]
MINNHIIVTYQRKKAPRINRKAFDAATNSLNFYLDKFKALATAL